MGELSHELLYSYPLSTGSSSPFLWCGLGWFIASLVLRPLATPYRKHELPFFVLVGVGLFVSWLSREVWLSLLGFFVVMLSSVGFFILNGSQQENYKRIGQLLWRALVGTLFVGVGLLGIRQPFLLNQMDLILMRQSVPVFLVLLGIWIVFLPSPRWFFSQGVFSVAIYDRLSFCYFYPLLSTLPIFLKLEEPVRSFLWKEEFFILSLGWIISFSILSFAKNTINEWLEDLALFFPFVVFLVFFYLGPHAAFFSFVWMSLCLFGLSILVLFKSNWVSRILFFLYGFVFLGGIGFALSGVQYALHEKIYFETPTYVLFLSFYFFFSLILWRSCFHYFSDVLFLNKKTIRWRALPLFLLVLLSLGLLSTGTLSGGAIRPVFDQVDSVTWLDMAGLEAFLNEIGMDTPQPNEYLLHFTRYAYFILLWLPLLIALFLGIKGGDRWITIIRALQIQSLGERAEKGIGLQKISALIFRWTDRFSRDGLRSVSESVWTVFFPLTTGRIASELSKVGQRAEQVTKKLTSSSLGLLLKTPSRWLSVIQNGDLQWYWAFGVIGTLVLLLHVVL